VVGINRTTAEAPCLEHALLRAKARKSQVDIEFSILGSAYKAQKSKNSRDLEGKKEFIKEAIKG